MNRHRTFLPLILVTVIAGFTACGQTEHAPTEEPAESPAPFRFTDVTDRSGIDWRMTYGTDETDYILETTGSGLAWFDYDNDGDADLYLVNGSHFNPDTLAKYHPRSALYRNDGDGTFTDVTNAAGVGHAGWGGAALAADFTNDGFRDLYVTGWGRNTFYRNNGDGTFTDATDATGTGDTGYSSAAAAIDYDRDGDLDIYVGNYVPFDPATAEPPGTGRYTLARGVPMSMAPEGYPGTPDVFYRNNGNGTFTNVAAEAGIDSVTGRALGVITLDYNRDGLPDIYVANDAMQNFLFRNNGDGTFTEVATRLGAAYGEGGIPLGSMGLAAADLDGDGWQEIIVANYEDQTANAYGNREGRYFTPLDVPSGIGGPSLIPLQWGVVAGDFDLDADIDVYIADGHVTSRLASRYPQSTYTRPNLVFANDGSGKFHEAGTGAGNGMIGRFSSRGAAGADFDNDGDLDIAVVNKSGPAQLLRNDGGASHHWLRVELRATRSAPDGIGALVEIVANGRRQQREVRAGSSYASTEDARPLFGVGATGVVDSLVVHWLSGRTDRYGGVPVNRTVFVTEGEGYGEVDPR